jgi:hypothetical protein
VCVVEDLQVGWDEIPLFFPTRHFRSGFLYFFFHTGSVLDVRGMLSRVCFPTYLC